jgi:hypothetical protein
MQAETIETLPVKPGDWVQDRNDASVVAKVKKAYFGSEGVLVDLQMFSRDGEKLKRASPAMGGPTAYEPACPYSSWQRISAPEFPFRLMWVDDGDGVRTASYQSCASVLPDREWTEPQSDPKPRAVKVGNYDPDLEANSRRMTAQELRAMARSTGVAELLKRAEELEKEADAIKPR